MRGFDITPALQDIARQLGVPLSGGTDLATRIVAACQQKVEKWCNDLGPVESFGDLLDVVSAKLKVHFEIVRSDNDLQEVRDRYMEARETGFINLDSEFDNFTDAVVLKLVKAEKWSNKQYVAVIDARGSKAPRQWFSQWHELAHLIAEPQTKFVFRRTQSSKRDPVERMMDQIAGELAFYSPLFLPALERNNIDLTHPTLASIAAFREEEFPFASLQSTINAVLRYTKVPAILIEAKYELKKSQQQRLSLDPSMAPKRELRAVTATHNGLAMKSKFYIHRWMRVPKRSVISLVYDGNLSEISKPQEENLSWWESQDVSLPDWPVLVDAQTAGNGRVLALITSSRTETKKVRRPRSPVQAAR